MSRKVDLKKKINQLAEEISRDWALSNDPLDGDEVEYFARLFWIELDLRQGNITEDEYNERLTLLEKGKVW